MKLRSFYNYCLMKYSYIHRKIMLKSMPRILAIELTNFCNLDCIMCPRRFMKREIGFMEFDLFKKIIDQCKYQTDFVWLHLFGESLYHPQLDRFIDYCSRNNVRAGLSTNATILSKDKASMILNSKLDEIYLCLDGCNKEVYEKVRRNADFDKTRANIMEFLGQKNKLKKKKPFTRLVTIKMNETEEGIDAFTKQWQGLVDDIYIKKFVSWANQDDEIASKRTGCEKADLLQKKNKRFPCISFWKDGVILWNGDFVPCCMDFDGKMALGNVGKEKLSDIWNSPKIKEVRRQQREGNYDNPLCKNCVEWVGSEENIFPSFKAVCSFAKREIFG